MRNDCIPLRGSFDPLRINWSSYEAPQKRTFLTSVLFFFDTGERSVPVLPVGLFKGTWGHKNVHGKEERFLFFA